MGGEDSRAGEEDAGLSPPNHERCDLEREAGAWLGKLHFLGRAPEGRKDPEGRHRQCRVRLASCRPPRLPDPLLGVGLVGAPKRVALLSRVCPEREASGFRTRGSGFRGREKKRHQRQEASLQTLTRPPALPADRKAALSWPGACTRSWHAQTFCITPAPETNLAGDLATL